MSLRSRMTWRDIFASPIPDREEFVIALTDAAAPQPRAGTEATFAEHVQHLQDAERAMQHTLRDLRACMDTIRLGVSELDTRVGIAGEHLLSGQASLDVQQTAAAVRRASIALHSVAVELRDFQREAKRHLSDAEACLELQPAPDLAGSDEDPHTTVMFL